MFHHLHVSDTSMDNEPVTTITYNKYKNVISFSSNINFKIIAQFPNCEPQSGFYSFEMQINL